MISEKKKEKKWWKVTVFHIEQKMEFEKFNWFFYRFLRYSFVRIIFISTVVEREYTPGITWEICFAHQLTDFFMITGFTKYFLADYCYILENHFYFVNALDYCLKPFLSRIFCVNKMQYIQIDENSRTEFCVVKCGVPQGSILGPLLFLLYVNDLKNASSILDPIMFAYDTNLFYTHSNIQLMKN